MHRDFDAARRERAAKRNPVTFTLGGERFTLLPVIPIGDAFDLLDAPEPEDNKEVAAQAIARFITKALVPGDDERFAEVLRSKADPIDPESLLEVGAFVAEVYTGRPTEPSAGSSGGRRKTGATSSKRGRKAS